MVTGWPGLHCCPVFPQVHRGNAYSLSISGGSMEEDLLMEGSPLFSGTMQALGF